ncbi:hypothetical protein ABZ630_14685, partial [Streptomyces albidoflavus]|uniref:hypothetical protein n=1 Tax=Streptomyces albidoflavus TaxID=1886 RepID=UPI0033F7F3BA
MAGLRVLLGPFIRHISRCRRFVQRLDLRLLQTSRPAHLPHSMGPIKPFGRETTYETDEQRCPVDGHLA